MLTNNGSGVFTVSADTSNGGAVYVHKIITKDFDNDGNTDIAFLGDSSGYSGLGNFSIIYGDGSGSFSDSWYYTPSYGSTYNMSAGDFNNDGLLDIIFARSANSSSDHMAVLVNKGSRAPFQFLNYNGLEIEKNYNIAAADFNGDYEMDGVTVGDSKVRFWLGRSDCNFSAITSNTITASNDPRVLTTADFNKDGKIDIATANNSDKTVSIYLNGYNFGPVIDAVSGTSTGMEDDLDIIINSSDMHANYSDEENDVFGGIKITKVPAGGTLMLGSSDNITAGQNISAADLAGKAIVYNPNDNWNGDTYLEWRPVDAQGSVGIIRRANISIASVIDSPVNIVPTTQVVNEDTPLSFSTTGNNAIQISDSDVEMTELMSTSITAENGTLTLNGTENLTFSSGIGSEDTTMTFTGIMSDINAALNGLSFIPTEEYSGSAAITIITDDLGNAGAGDPLLDTDTVDITVNSVNDVPTFTKGANQTVDEDCGAQTAAGWATDMSAGSSNETDQSLAFTATNNNNSLFTVQPAVAANGTLTYTPAVNANGATTVTLTLKDDGGTDNGGVETSVAQTFTITVNSVNDVPSFTKGTNQIVNEDCGTQTVANWANDISAGNTNESSQMLTFNVTNDNEDLFSEQPAVAANGTLTFTPAENVNGSATITMALKDDGGTDIGGADTSADQTFTITVNAVNDAPTFTKGANQTVDEDCIAQTVIGWATGMSAGSSNETDQSLAFTATNSNNDLFIVQPTVAADGTLTYTPAENSSGSATVTLTLKDDGGTDNGGVETSVAQTFTITVDSVNDVPSFTKGANQTVNEDCIAQTVAGWATDISRGNTNESSQVLTFTVTNDNNSLFSEQPAVAVNGTLAYTPAADANGSATITLALKDDGGTDSGGADTSTDQTFTITVNSVNDAPTLDIINDISINEEAEQDTLSLTGISSGAGNEGQNLTVTAVSSNTTIIPDPVISYTSDDSMGTLTYRPIEDAFGDVEITVTVSDDGGTDGSGINTLTRTFVISVEGVNDVPSFTKGTNQIVNEDCGAQTVAGWATDISRGNTNESSQVLTFTVTNDNISLFSEQPEVAVNGTLTFTPAENANGSATVTLTLKDDGGTDRGGVDTSAVQTFTITVNSVNDAPTFTKGANQTVDEDCIAQTVAGWATDISTGPSDEAGQSLDFTATNNNNSLFTVQPAVAADGTLTYTPAENSNGSATVTLTLKDDGGTDNGGVETSVAKTFTITVDSVNDVPSFTKGANQIVNEDCGAQMVAGWATDISKGNTNESSQELTFTVTNDNNSLFSEQPAVAANGTLAYTPAADANGSATITLALKDDGGTGGGGADTSAEQTFTITVNPVNDAPTLDTINDIFITEGTEQDTLSLTGISSGAGNEVQNLTVTAVSSNTTIIPDPVISYTSADLTGTLTYTPIADAFGNVEITVTVSDDGGTDGSGINTLTMTFMISVNGVNDVPSFTKGTDQIVNENCGSQTVAGWATDISAGNSNESSQMLTFIVTNDNNSLFSEQPAVAANGTLTFTPAPNANGSATITLTLKDNGGTDNGGADTWQSKPLL